MLIIVSVADACCPVIPGLCFRATESLHIEERESLEWPGTTWKTKLLKFVRWTERKRQLLGFFWPSCVAKKEVINHGNEQNLCDSSPHHASVLKKSMKGRGF